MNIDFSKKPEGATHFYHDHHGRLGSWWKVSSERSGPPSFVYSPFEGQWIAMAHVPCDILPIPDNKTLTGEGLPPIGADVEVVSPGYSNPRFDRFIGQVVTVVAYDVIDGDPVAVFRMPINGDVEEQDYHALIAKCFKPARTPEQIAEEAQQAAIAVIENRIMARMGDLNVRNLAEDLHGLLQEMAVKP